MYSPEAKEEKVNWKTVPRVWSIAVGSVEQPFAALALYTQLGLIKAQVGHCRGVAAELTGGEAVIER